MKLAEALIIRADYQKRIEQLKTRLESNAKVQEGEKVAEDPQALLKELLSVVDKLKTLVQRINLTNTKVIFDKKQTLADALTERDAIKAKFAIYRQLAEDATVKQDRYSKFEIKFKSTVDIPSLQKTADKLAIDYRELDTKIQERNWLVDIIE